MNDVVKVMRPDQQLPVQRWLPASGRGPGLLVIQEIFGVSDYIQQRCAGFAEAGYVVYAPELYFRQGTPSFDQAAADYVQQGIAAAQKLDWQQTVADTSAALDALRAAPEVVGGVGIVGYCFGGGMGFAVAAVNAPEALVSYYGSAIPGLLDLAAQVTCPSQHHWGLSDSFFTPDVVERVERAISETNPTAEFHTYAGAGHAFDNPNPMFHHQAAADLARLRTLDFLGTHLGVS